MHIPRVVSLAQHLDSLAVVVCLLRHAAGGRLVLVGGYLRDALLGISPRDIDIEVHGLGARQIGFSPGCPLHGAIESGGAWWRRLAG
jgi:hypothetical protein